MRVLGVDPGLLNFGYIVLENRGRDYKILSADVLKTSPKLALGSRLWHIYKGLEKILEEYKPEMIAVEEPLPQVNSVNTAKIVQVFALVLLASEERRLPYITYHPSQWKSFLCGDGRATKEDLLKVIQSLLGRDLDSTIRKVEHILDALGIALVSILEKGERVVL